MASAQKSFHVSPSGRPNGNGSEASPWDLATALAHPPAVQPGDTIWLHGGKYYGLFISKLQGLPNLPVIVRQFPGERAILDQNESQNGSILKINGGWTWYWGFEVMNSNPLRNLQITGSNPNVRRANSIDVYGSGTKLINLLIHDAGQGLGMWSQAVDTEAYGNIIFNNGWSAPDRGHGHGVYTQNTTGTKVYRDNISFNQFGNVFATYGSSASVLKGFQIEGNVFFNGRVLIGGNSPAEEFTVKDNYFFNNTPEFGWGNPNNRNLTVTGNYIPGGVFFKWWKNATVVDNTIFNVLKTDGSKSLAIYMNPDGQLSDYTMDRNTYIQSNEMGFDFYVVHPPKPALSPNFGDWQKLGFDRAGKYIKAEGGSPKGLYTVVRPNEYEKDRANIVIYNWDRAKEVDVDLANFKIPFGGSWELRNAQNLSEVISGVYRGGKLKVPMNRWTTAIPVGMNRPLGPPTFPTFGVFILERKKASPNAALTLMDVQATYTFPTSVTLVWVTNKPATCEVEYGITTGYGASFKPPAAGTTSHAAGLRGLTPGTVYHYRIRGIDPEGGHVDSGDLTFTTPEK